jgi:hypothetical protein
MINNFNNINMAAAQSCDLETLALFTTEASSFE